VRQKCLMLGAGHTDVKRKLVAETSAPENETKWITLDSNPNANPDVLFELGVIEQVPSWLRVLWMMMTRRGMLPFKSEEFDEIHAYEILEHYGSQGDFKGFFRGFKELWRILKPQGVLIGTCPSWHKHWAWGDPGHKRIITEGTLSYLTREMHATLGTVPTTDYARYVDPCWWKIAFFEHNPETEGLAFAIKKSS